MSWRVWYSSEWPFLSLNKFFSSDTSTKREAAILKISPPAIITSAEVIIAEYDAIFGQWEREDFYNHLSNINYTNTFSPPWTRSKPLFSKLDILSLHSLYKFHVSCFVFSHFNRLLPASLSSLLHFNRDFHDYLTRTRFNLHKMSLRYQFAICSQAPTIWNDIPLTVRDSLTTTNFK